MRGTLELAPPSAPTIHCYILTLVVVQFKACRNANVYSHRRNPAVALRSPLHWLESLLLVLVQYFMLA